MVQVSYLLKSKVFNIGKRIACLKDFLEEKDQTAIPIK